MKCFGSSTSFVSVICIYGYSYSIFLPVVIACSFPIDIMQWVLIAYGVFSSTSLILVNYWKELSKYIDKKRYILLGIIILCQAGLFFTLKLYFFEKYNEVQKDTTVVPVTPTNNTAVNGTLLLF